MIRLQVHKRYFLAWQAALQGFYRNRTGWRGPRLCFLLSLFAKDGVGAPLVGAQADEQGGHEGRPYDESDEEDDVGVPLVGALADGEVGQEGRPFVATEPADELRYKQLVLLLADEVAAVEQEFEYEEKLNEERAAIERDACLAPAGEEWRMLLRREESLDRAIARKIKLLLSLRKAAQKPQTLESRSAPAEDVGAPLVGARAHDECGPTNEQPSPLGRGCQAPAGEEWRMLLRREESLDRAIDRKIKLLLSLRKAAQKPQTLESRSAPAEDVGAPLVGAQAHDECATTNEQPSPLEAVSELDRA